MDQLQDVAELSEVISIPAGESRGFFLEYQDPRNQENAPAIGVVTPVASIDWMLNDQADNSGSVLTGSGSITFAAFAETCVATLTNGSASVAYLTMFKVRGLPIQREPYVSIQGNDTASQSLYGIRDDTLETRPVSYTHLDVYKRQFRSCMVLNAVSIIRNGVHFGCTNTSK